MDRFKAQGDHEDLVAERQRALTGGIANGDKVLFEGEERTVNAISAGGVHGSRVRLYMDEGHRWVESNLVKSVAKVERAA